MPYIVKIEIEISSEAQAILERLANRYNEQHRALNQAGRLPASGREWQTSWNVPELIRHLFLDEISLRRKMNDMDKSFEILMRGF